MSDDWTLAEDEDMGEGIHARVRVTEYVEDFDNPREDRTNLGVMFCDYRGYNLGDDDAPDPRERTVTCERCEGSGWVEQYEGSGKVADEDGEVSCPVCGGDGEAEVGMFEYLKREHGATVVLPLFVYEHSGISMSCGENMGAIDPRGRNPFDSAAWDTSMVGFIFDTNETRAETGAPLDSIEQQLRGEVDEYDSYLRGEVYYWEVVGLDEDGDVVEEYDRLGSYLGSEGAKYALEEAKSSAEAEVAKRKRARHNTELALACWRD